MCFSVSRQECRYVLFHVRFRALPQRSRACIGCPNRFMLVCARTWTSISLCVGADYEFQSTTGVTVPRLHLAHWIGSPIPSSVV